MFLPDTSPPAVNGETPVPASVGDRQRAQLNAMDAAEKRARWAVLGYCNDPASYSEYGVNLVVDAASVPAQYSISGNSVQDVSPAAVDNPSGVGIPNVVGPGDSLRASHANGNVRYRYPLRTSQPQRVPVIPLPSRSIARGALRAIRAANDRRSTAAAAAMVPPSGTVQQGSPISPDTAPPWQDALTTLRPPSAAQDFSQGVLSWIRRNPLLAIGGALVLFGAAGKKGRR